VLCTITKRKCTSLLSTWKMGGLRGLEQMEQSNTSMPMVTFCILPPLIPSWQPTPLLLLSELTDTSIATKAPLRAIDSSTSAPQKSIHSELVTTIGALLFRLPLIITKQYQRRIYSFFLKNTRSCYLFNHCIEET
jgi:hypothetical protein